MTEALLAIAISLVAVAFILLVALAVRRVALARRDRRRLEAERRVRPLAIALIEDEEADLPALSAYDQQALADVLARYSRKLSGEAGTRIGAYFRTSAALRAARGELGSRNAWRRAQAAYRLGDMCCPEVAPELEAALDDKRQDVRASAARSLGRLGVVEAASLIIEQLVAERLPYGVAGEALVELGSAAVPELSRISEDAAPSVRATALTVIGFVGDATDSGAVLRALRDPSAEVREAAAEALGRVGAYDAEVELTGRLDDRVRGVRAAAATALGQIDARPALPKLIELARTDIFRPARAAARAVARIDPVALERVALDPDASRHLQEAADRQAL